MIVVYLLYTIYEADWQLRQAGDFYQALGVPHDVGEKGIQSRFRRLTVQFHPDKVSGADRPAVEAIYVQMKLARDTLADPAKRFAYDRFGPDVLKWRNMKTIRDFVFHGVQQTTGYYAVSGVVLILLGMLGYLNHGMFWRYFAMAALYIIEVYFVTRPKFPTILAGVLNPFLIRTGLRPVYLPYQMLSLLRKLSITFFIALSQLGPLLQGPQQQLQEGGAITPQLLQQVQALGKQADQEVSRLMAMELAPFAGEQEIMKDVRGRMKDWLVQNTYRNDQEVGRAVAGVLTRRRNGAAVEAGGQGDAGTG